MTGNTVYHFLRISQKMKTYFYELIQEINISQIKHSRFSTKVTWTDNSPNYSLRLIIIRPVYLFCEEQIECNNIHNNVSDKFKD